MRSKKPLSLASGLGSKLGEFRRDFSSFAFSSGREFLGCPNVHIHQLVACFVAIDVFNVPFPVSAKDFSTLRTRLDLNLYFSANGGHFYASFLMLHLQSSHVNRR
jgi:hypothetical protein